jgi:nicotinamide riboside kinase
MKNICFFGSPGTGKSTLAATLFGYMKSKDYEVEYVTEYAKDLVYSKDFMTLSDQVMVFAKQQHAWFKLKKSNLRFTINDSPFIMGIAYIQDNEHLPRDTFESLLVQMYKSYDTINFYINRDFKDDEYRSSGRRETLNESLEIDKKIREVLGSSDIEVNDLYFGPDLLQQTITILQQKGVL